MTIGYTNPFKGISPTYREQWALLYAEVFHELKSEGDRVKISERFAKMRSKCLL